MILRAQLKPIAEMPPEVFCCEFRRERILAAKGMIVEVRVLEPTGSRCEECGHVQDRCFRIVGSEKVINPRMWDIEEAPGGEGPGDSHEQARAFG